MQVVQPQTTYSVTVAYKPKPVSKNETGVSSSTSGLVFYLLNPELEKLGLKPREPVFIQLRREGPDFFAECQLLDLVDVGDSDESAKNNLAIFIRDDKEYLTTYDVTQLDKSAKHKLEVYKKIFV